MSRTYQYVNVDVLKIFPRTVGKGRVIVDEKCECGHLRSSHYGIGPVAGHGGCGQPSCDCQKFTWTGSVEAAKRKRR